MPNNDVDAPGGVHPIIQHRRLVPANVKVGCGASKAVPGARVGWLRSAGIRPFANTLVGGEVAP